MAKVLFQTGAMPGRPAAVRLVVLAVLGLSACKGGTGTAYNYLSPYAPPSPVSPSVLTAVSGFVAPSQVAALESAAQALLTSDPRYTRQYEPAWQLFNSAGQYLGTAMRYPLMSSGAAFAHAAGLTGAGQLVAIADTRLNSTHEVFASGHPASLSILSNPAPTGDVGFDAHGTTVTGIIAGQSSSFIGVAPGASVLFGTFTDANALINVTNAATANGAVALNNSWGFDSLPVSNGAFQTIFSDATGQAYLSALDNYAANGVVVFASSNNEAHSHSTLMDALPYVRPSLEAGWIAVGSAVPVMAGNNVQSVTMVSAGCMEAARWCILADGGWTGPTSASNSSYGQWEGTSFAAPQVSGALALLGEAFPSLTPHELRVRLLASADNHFFSPDATVELATGFNKGYSFTYGLGFLDIEAALLPIGPTQMSMPNGQAAQPVGQPLIMSGAAMGDAVARSLAGVDVAVTDVLNTTFQMPGSSLATTVMPTPLGRTLLEKSATTNLAMARTMPDSSLNDPFAAFSGQTYSAFSPTGDLGASVLISASQNFGLDVKRALTDGPTRIEVGLKLARDAGNVMGFGATDKAGTNMASLELGVTQDLGRGGFVSLGGEMGVADLGQQAMLTSVSSARFNSVNLQIGSHDAFTRGDRLTLAVGMPVAVTSGRAQAVLPVASARGLTSFQPVDIDLSPSDRQTDISLSYQVPLSDHAELMAKLVHSENYGNRAGLSDTGAVLGLNFAF